MHTAVLCSSHLHVQLHSYRVGTLDICNQLVHTYNIWFVSVLQTKIIYNLQHGPSTIKNCSFIISNLTPKVDVLHSSVPTQFTRYINMSLSFQLKGTSRVLSGVFLLLVMNPLVALSIMTDQSLASCWPSMSYGTLSSRLDPQLSPQTCNYIAMRDTFT